MAINDITGDALISRAPSEAYKNNYDLIFGKKKSQSDQLDEPIGTRAIYIKNDPLYQQGRADAFEEAAKVCLETGIKHPDQTGQEACAVAIRSLK